jgi:hypothetical protein
MKIAIFGASGKPEVKVTYKPVIQMMLPGEGLATRQFHR